MKPYIIVLLITILNTTCTQPAQPANKQVLTSSTANNSPVQSYTEFKEAVEKKRITLSNKDISEAAVYLFELLNKDIPAYWIGTRWDFNGTTRIPQTGMIACGYFITNTLTDLGFRINRIKLAQCPSLEMIKTLCTDVKGFTSLGRLRQYLQKMPDKSAFIIGLDFHTGYILKDNTGIYFLHSNYINSTGVMKERIDSSAALGGSKNFFVGCLTGNKILLQKWIK